MQNGPDSNTDLQDLLAQLGRFLSANENRISAAQVSNCFQHLSTNEISALHRLFFLLCKNKRSDIHRLRTTQRLTNGFSGCAAGLSGNVHVRPHVNEMSLTEPGHHRYNRISSSGREWPEREDGSSTLSRHHLQGRGTSSPPIPANGDNIPKQRRGTYAGDALVTLISDENNHQDIPNIRCSKQTASCQQSSSNTAAKLPTLAIATPYQRDEAAVQNWADYNSCGSSRLSACVEIKLTPSTERLLENCKTDPTQFLRAIKEAKVALPNGQGWEAALATKKENTDIRDLLRIYHRFECFNIYSHVVEAGYHTSMHWVRDGRSSLIKKLCEDFPNRFQSQKAANKCLNCVDQGCKYHEWIKIFSETEDLGYLIALPSDMPHSAYTSRCTREQMNAAAIKFKELGIDELVRDLELSRLGNHIASALRDMTAKKNRHASGETPQVSCEPMQLNSFSSVDTPVPTAPPESIIPSTDENPLLFDTNTILISPEYDFGCQAQLISTMRSDYTMSQLPASLLPADNWYQYLHETENHGES
ncbi:hypothetical protein H0G86_010006 [Trichoderma simmonsii]|uniref:Uncharacterized protein n=1 Tax=Trichoderma simmonsii TaxID=1491479 RepID=A0A8G0LNX4_9HYPO|nr:hypothetical protein H0G86_010006 [Trichoderma simmonsii]